MGARVTRTDELGRSVFSDIQVGGFFSRHGKLYIKTNDGNGAHTNATMVSESPGFTCVSKFGASEEVVLAEVDVRWKLLAGAAQ